MENHNIVSFSSFQNTTERSDSNTKEELNNNIDDESRKYEFFKRDLNEGAKEVYNVFLNLSQNSIPTINSLTTIIKSLLLDMYKLDYERKKSLLTVNIYNRSISKEIEFLSKTYQKKVAYIKELLDGFKIIDETHFTDSKRTYDSFALDSSFRYAIENYISELKIIRRSYLYIMDQYNNTVTACGLFKAYFKLLDKYLYDALHKTR